MNRIIKIMIRVIFTIFSLFVFTSVNAIVCDHNLIVYQRGSGLNPTSVSNIQTMISQLNAVGTYLCWDGTNSANPNVVTGLISVGLYDTLLALNPSNSNPIWDTTVANTVESLLESGHLQKLVVFDRYSNEDVNVVGLNGMVVRDLEAWIHPIDANSPPSTGPAGTVGSWQGNYAAHGYFNCIDYDTFKVSHPESNSYYVNGANKSVLVDYCVGGNTVVFSTTPMDFYLSGVNNVKALNYFTNTMNLLMKQECQSCRLNYRLLFAHSPAHGSYRALRVNGQEDDECEVISTSHQHLGYGPLKESHSVRLFANGDCTGTSVDLECTPWLDYASMPSTDFGSCSHNGTHLSLSGLPNEATHVMSGGDWVSVSVVGNSATVLCPGDSWEVDVCSGVDCDWNTELMYNMVDAGTESCIC